MFFCFCSLIGLYLKKEYPILEFVQTSEIERCPLIVHFFCYLTVQRLAWHVLLYNLYWLCLPKAQSCGKFPS